MDPLTATIIAQAAGLVLKPALEAVAEDVAKDTAKDYVKKCFGRVFSFAHKEPLEQAALKAVKELLEAIEHELSDTGMALYQIEQRIAPVKQFVKANETEEAIQQAFVTSDSRVDPALFRQAWRPFEDAHPLTEDFSWSRVARAFSRAVQKLRADDKELRDILSAQALAEIAATNKQQAGIAPEFDLAGYRQSLLEAHANLKLELLDATGSAYRVKLWTVFGPQTVRDCQEYFPQHFELPKEHFERLRQSGELTAEALSEEMIELRRRSYVDQSPRSVLEVVGDERLSHVVILGDPGAGKSTLLKWLALEWARTPDATAREAQPLPLLIELGMYDRWECASGKSFVRYLQDAQTVHRLEQFRLDETLRRAGGAMLLLDGLDEIFDPARRKAVVNDIHRFSNEYPQTRVIVTSRVIGYDQRQLADAGFRHFMLQDLDEAQITDFLDRWYGTFISAESERAQKRNRLARAVAESRAIRELAANPLLLTMMSILNLHQELPRDRVKLYERTTEVLLHHWDFERLGLQGAIEYREKAEMLRRLADFMQNAPAGLQGNIVAGDDLRRIFRDYLKELDVPNTHEAAKDVVRQLRERNFILCHLGADRYAFVHRTLLEYFCASALVRRALKEPSSLEFLKHEVYGKHWNDETWHEVLRLIAGMEDQVPTEHIASIIEFLFEQDTKDPSFRNIFLAADCCHEVRYPNVLGLVLKRVASSLRELLHLPSPSTDTDVFSIKFKTVGYLAKDIFVGNARDWLQNHAVYDDDPPVRQAAVEGLAYGWPNDAGLVSWLKTIAVNNTNEDVRYAAIIQLGRGWRNDPDVIVILKNAIANQEHAIVQHGAVQQIARCWKDDPDTLPWLKYCAVQAINYAARMSAVEELARGWRTELDTLPMLTDRAINDDDKWVRRTALRELMRGWKAAPNTLALLKNRAAHDNHWAVRQAATQELARGWGDDPEVTQLLKRLEQQEADAKEAGDSTSTKQEDQT